MPVHFQNPLFNCDHIKEDFFLESKGTKKEGKDYVNKEIVSGFHGNSATKLFRSLFLLYAIVLWGIG